MANKVYPKWKEALLGAAANSALTGTGTTGLYAVLIDTGVYTYNDVHQFYSSLSGIPATEREITAVTLVNGIVDGNNITFPTVSAGAACEAIVLFRKNAGRQVRHGSWSAISTPSSPDCLSRPTAATSPSTGMPPASSGYERSTLWLPMLNTTPLSRSFATS